MQLSILQLTYEYVSNAPYFWPTMGMVTAVSIFVGAIIFDGKLPIASKGVFGLLSYVFFLVQVQLTRVKDTLIKLNSHGVYDYMGFASTMTIIIMTVFWTIGVFIGVYTSHCIRKSMEKGVNKT